MGKSFWILGTLLCASCLPVDMLTAGTDLEPGTESQPERTPATEGEVSPLPPLPEPIAKPEFALPSAWEIREISQIEILNQRGEGPQGKDPVTNNFASFKNRRLCAIGSAPGECQAGGPLPDFVTNGTFYDGQGYVMGLTLRHGILDQLISTGTKYYSRGIFTQLEDGTFNICYGAWNGPPMDADELAARCGVKGARPREALGGGALLLHRGQRACSENSVAAPCDAEVDLSQVQRFDNGGVGIDASQFRKTQHTVAALRDGHAYLAWPKDGAGGRSGRQIQNDFLAAGFSDAVKFDGGSGFFVRGNGNLKAGTGSNSSGILVHSPKP